MANFGGGLYSTPIVAGPLPRLTRGRIAQQGNPRGGDLIFTTPPFAGGVWGAGPGRAGPSGSPIGAAEFTRHLSIGGDWFDHVHILPRTTIDFGNIVTPVAAEYEIFSAFAIPISFLSYVNNAGAGISLPNLPTPVSVLQPFNSMLDPSTVRGTQVKLTVVADPNGPPAFDSFIHFVFDPGNEVDLFIKGSRIALVTPEADTPVIEILRFGTSVLEIAGGKEQRISIRKQPRQAFIYEWITDGAERRVVQALMFGWQAMAFGLPLWHERMALTAAVGIGANVVNVASTTDIDLRIDGYAVLFKDFATYDVLQIQSLTATTITFVSNTVHAYAVGDLVLPIRTVRMESALNATRFPGPAQIFRPHFESVDNDTGAPTGSVAGWPSFNGRVLLSGPLLLQGASLEEQYQQRLTILDGETGLVFQQSTWDRNKRTYPIGFAANTRAQVYALRRLLYALRGRQVAFWVPTFITDMVVVANLGIASTQMQIANIGYTRYVQSRHPKATFAITFTDGTSLVRTILSSVETSTTVETLTLDAAWPVTRLVAEVSDVQFYELVRFDTDELRIVHHGHGRARLFAPVKVVFDL